MGVAYFVYPCGERDPHAASLAAKRRRAKEYIGEVYIVARRSLHSRSAEWT
jgi:hypothetical protein